MKVRVQFCLIYENNKSAENCPGTKQINFKTEGAPDVELSTGSSGTGVIQSDAHEDGLSQRAEWNVHLWRGDTSEAVQEQHKKNFVLLSSFETQAETHLIPDLHTH